MRQRMPGTAGQASGFSESKNQADRQWLWSCTIITTDAAELIAPIHDRMPVNLDGEVSSGEWIIHRFTSRQDVCGFAAGVMPMRSLSQQ